MKISVDDDGESNADGNLSEVKVMLEEGGV